MNKPFCTVLAISLLMAAAPVAFAEQEVEPNNFEENATPVSGSQVAAAVNDEKDWFLVRLPAKGPVTLQLAGLPPDLKVQLGVKGFPHVGWEDGVGDVRYSFDAANTEGMVWVQFQWADSVCGADWCAARFSPNGPWYGIKPSAKMPPMHEGKPILAGAPPYTLIIGSAAAKKSPTGPDAASRKEEAVQWDTNQENVIWDEPPAEEAPPGQIIWEDETPGLNEEQQQQILLNSGDGEGG